MNTNSHINYYLNFINVFLCKKNNFLMTKYLMKLDRSRMSNSDGAIFSLILIYLSIRLGRTRIRSTHTRFPGHDLFVSTERRKHAETGGGPCDGEERRAAGIRRREKGSSNSFNPISSTQFQAQTRHNSSPAFQVPGTFSTTSLSIPFYIS